MNSCNSFVILLVLIFEPQIKGLQDPFLSLWSRSPVNGDGADSFVPPGYENGNGILESHPEVSSVRAKRDTSEARRTSEPCCATHMTSLTEKQNRILQECYEEHIQDMHDESSALCSLQCLGEKENMTDREGYIVDEGFIPGVQDLYPEQTIKAAVQTLAPPCTGRANELAKGMMAKDPEKYKCNPALYYAILCILVDVEENCPKSLRRESDYCTEYRRRMLNIKLNMQL
ncbi:uncharacterized protein [Periplaneta americana]|uniref:uncharacterized protein n=1 Tax=Periplaneta americana TaxID=6978 RepID=UPI0037E8996B